VLDIDAELLKPILNFLRCTTPHAWLQAACANQSVLLIDHANCEKKAASTAMNLMYKFTDRPELLKKMSQLAREELLHFQQVVELMQARGVSYESVSASRYASSLRALSSAKGEAQLVDTLLIGAIIEARSCERFAALAPLLDAELAKFYRSLLKSEARHYEDYLELARLYGPAAGVDVDARINELLDAEAALVTGIDEQFRFHSGSPAAKAA
jgi:tRNA-(ms[2]io[6]A)-hydroxylase